MEAQNDATAAPAKVAAKTAKPTAASFGMNMPLMSSAFDTASWLAAA